MADALTTTGPDLLARMVEGKQLSAMDVETLGREAKTNGLPQSEQDVLHWLAKEYDVAFSSLDEVEPDRQLLSLFPARVLLKEQLLPLRRVNGHIEVATSRLFATHAFDGIDTKERMTATGGATLAAAGRAAVAQYRHYRWGFTRRRR